jgi:flagellar hook-associated protein 1 FlgK
MGLNATLAMASRSLQVFATGIEVAGQNIANAGTPGYIREELVL